MAWLEGEPTQLLSDSDYPPRWFHDAFRYIFASAILHRSRTAILRPGSSPSQRLREKLVVGLLSNQYPRRGDRPLSRRAHPRMSAQHLQKLMVGHMAVVRPEDWEDWLRASRAPEELLRPFPPASFTIAGPKEIGFGRTEAPGAAQAWLL